MDRAALVCAAARNHTSWMEGVARVTGGGVVREGALRWIVAGTGEVSVPFPRRASGRALDAMLAWCASRGVARIGVWATGLEPEDAVEARLAERGFAAGWRPHWMAMEASALPLDDHDARVSIVDAVPEYDGYGQALLGLAGGRFWHAAARIDGVYAGHAWVHRVGDHAGIYDVDIRPLFRRQGLGRALTLAVCRASGARTVVLNATGDGEALYRALGFRSLGYGRTLWREGSGGEWASAG
jgi:ribosomal protein S18 acetylase RimI-like enzyme